MKLRDRPDRPRGTDTYLVQAGNVKYGASKGGTISVYPQRITDDNGVLYLSYVWRKQE